MEFKSKFTLKKKDFTDIEHLKGEYEIRLRFRDEKYCNLSCIYCFDMNLNFGTTSINHIGNAYNKYIEGAKFIRVTGGEPFVSENCVMDLISIIKKIKMDVNSPVFYVHTNGLKLFEDMTVNGTLQTRIESVIDAIGDSKAYFDYSFKGTNAHEYEILLGLDDVAAKNTIAQQVDNYHELSRLIKNKDNLTLVPKLGIFHSAMTGGKYVFVKPSTDELMFQMNDFDDRIKAIFDSYEYSTIDDKKYYFVERLGRYKDTHDVQTRHFGDSIDKCLNAGILKKNSGRYKFKDSKKFKFLRADQIIDLVVKE